MLSFFPSLSLTLLLSVCFIHTSFFCFNPNWIVLKNTLLLGTKSGFCIKPEDRGIDIDVYGVDCLCPTCFFVCLFVSFCSVRARQPSNNSIERERKNHRTENCKNKSKLSICVSVESACVAAINRSRLEKLMAFTQHSWMVDSTNQYKIADNKRKRHKTDLIYLMMKMVFSIRDTCNTGNLCTCAMAQTHTHIHLYAHKTMINDHVLKMEQRSKWYRKWLENLLSVTIATKKEKKQKQSNRNW